MLDAPPVDSLNLIGESIHYAVLPPYLLESMFIAARAILAFKRRCSLVAPSRLVDAVP